MSGSICALGPPQEGSRLIRRTPRNNTSSNTASNRRVSYGKELAMQCMGNHGTATEEKNSDPSTDSVLFASLMLSGLSCYAGHATHDQLIAAEKSPRPHTHTREEPPPRLSPRLLQQREPNGGVLWKRLHRSVRKWAYLPAAQPPREGRGGAFFLCRCGEYYLV